ncbi:hypothetical protein K466DRAFT_568959, partial [Polyporus arcularius HHB13444]
MTKPNAQSGSQTESGTQPALVRLARTPQLQWVELIAVLERCFNFAHTGAAEVLARGLMDCIWTSRAIVQGFMRMFFGRFTFSGSNFMVPELPLKVWPRKKDQLPYVTSKHTQVLIFQSYLTTFNIKLALESLAARPPPRTPVCLRSCTLDDLVNRVYLVALAQTKHNIGSPIWSQGTLWPVLRVIVTEAKIKLIQASILNAKGHEQCIKKALRWAFLDAHIFLVPDAIAGASHEPTVCAWTMVGNPEDHQSGRTISSVRSPDEQLAIRLTQSGKQVAAADYYSGKAQLNKCSSTSFNE